MIYRFNRSANYFRIVVMLILAFMLSIHSSITYAQWDLSALVKKVDPAVVVINVFDKGGKLKGIGTGFFVKEEGILVTNYHVIAGGVRAEAKLSSGEVVSIEGILSEDREGDLILLSLEVKGRSFPVLKLTDTKIEAGQPVVVIGSPFGLEGTVSNGIISAVRDIPKLGKILQITAPISKGSSGSPVLNMKGELVGIATLYIKEGQSLNFAISIDRVAGLLSSRQAMARKLFELVQEEEQKWSETPQGQFILGLNLLEGGRYKEAILHFKKSIQKQPDFAWAYFNLGLAYRRLNYNNEAIEAYKQAIRIKPDLAEAHYNLGWVYGELGLHNKAVETYKQAIMINPNDAETHYSLGREYLILGDNHTAIEEFKQAIQLKPDYSSAYTSLGVVYSRLGRIYEAAEAHKQAIQINPDDAVAHYNLGELYLLLFGNRHMAFEQYKILKELDVELANKLFNLIYR